MNVNYKYKSLKDFKKAHLSEYNYLSGKGLLEQFCIDMGWVFSRKIKHDSWTKETCLAEARKYQAKTKWYKASNSSYKAAIKNGWLDECTAHMVEYFTPSGTWTKERCLEEARKYSIKEHWKKGHHKSYSHARRNGWYDECVSHMVEGCKPRNYWTKERCHEEALKFSVKEHWKKGHPKSYQAAQRNGWVDELTKHTIEVCKPSGYWTKERCIEDAKKYDTIKEWTNSNTTPITNARINGWLDECTAHMVRKIKPSGYWLIKENCIEEALKYSKIKDWSHKSSASYKQSRANGWYDECIAHMKKQKMFLHSWTKETCLEESLKYKTRTE
jgi:hypothetical protein